MPQNNAKSPSVAPEDFLDRLQRYPELQAEFEAILDIVDNSSGDVVGVNPTLLSPGAK
jgi:hypothetical protein